MDQKERRKHKRRKILDSFSLFLTIPSKGNHKLSIKDVSEEGIAFESIHSEQEVLSLNESETLEVHFYLNQTLFLSLFVKVARLDPPSVRDSTVFTGVEILKKESKNHQSYLSFIQMIDHLTVST